MIIPKLLATTCGLLLAGAVMATDGIWVGGDLSQTVAITGNIDNSVGPSARGSQEIGTISGYIHVTGSLTQSVTITGHVSNSVSEGGRGCQKIGTITGGQDYVAQGVFN